MVALVGSKIYVLRASDLSNIRTIALVGPSNVVHTYRGRSFPIKPRIAAMEVSPQRNIVAALWVQDLLYGRVDLYDLSNGSHIQSWNTPQGWVNFTRDLSWTPDAKSILVGIPNETPCASPGNTPDVFAFDPYTGTIQHRLTTGLLVGDVAVTTGDRVLAVDSDCLGVFKNHHPKLRVFNIVTGKRVRELRGKGTGVRYTVSCSADGSRCLAFTGRMKAEFDWGDMVPVDKVIDETFSVWDLRNYQGIVTSQNIPGLKGLRISPNGRYAVSFGKASFVFQLP
ncbi:MAG: WD40 repeat domain-containing protein [Candidatus Acidiferrales bacterium]